MRAHLRLVFQLLLFKIASSQQLITIYVLPFNKITNQFPTCFYIDLH